MGILCHGKKRPAEHEPDADQPLAKKFGRLQIDALANHSGLENRETPLPLERSSNSTDAMLLDDTKDTTYIHDLAREIAEAEAEELQVSFLPGIVEKLTPIPKAILAGPKPQSNELVLYREPTSLTMPKEHDCIRRAIIDSKERARAKRTQPRKFTPDSLSHVRDVDHGNCDTICNEDAMDIDVER